MKIVKSEKVLHNKHAVKQLLSVQGQYQASTNPAWVVQPCMHASENSANIKILFISVRALLKEILQKRARRKHR